MSTLKTDTLSNVAGSLSIGTDRIAQGTAAAWVNFNGTGVVAIRASYNVSSITDNGTGDYTVNFTAALIDGNYSLVCAVGPRNGLHGRDVRGYASDAGGTAYSSLSARIESYNIQTSLRDDTESLNVAVFR
jgi:hypothetical protein